MAQTLPPFHLAFPVDNLKVAREFYGDLLGCPEGRSSDEWVDFDFYGHQIVAHMADCSQNRVHYNSVDSHAVPVPHFGAVLNMAQWEKLAEKLKAAAVKFVIEPYVRFKGQAGEQATMFLHDPFGNAIEIKAFASLESLFAK
ncbi:glyoxalase/bleomycin resistance protein [Neokomagataea thailandica NBRC 106555]|uniref:Glyoxalase n=2 Tax=Neokomagataea TaxID=1223423 RepID=A0A4Y6V9Y6_9PROT|nr:MULTISPECIES: VOC family protein [Neokomagataea]QDH25257.1 glyoxalase [Neokomagataea tanensis]GBR54288.1 glyoxalase/bleomycin resistance protein [Neokomagataea thailandica NBRC 106555]